MSDRKEYLKKYRLTHKEKYRKYQAKYRENHLSTYEKLQQENQELKKQLEDSEKAVGTFFIGMTTLKNQQKEFIELLEKEIVDSKEGSSQQYYAKEHLRLFKEIIGVSNE